MKRWAGGLLVGMLLALSVPAVATHIQEPTIPIEDMGVALFLYPDRSTKLACDGDDVWVHDRMRVRVMLGADTQRTSPSEHWDAEIKVFTAERGKGEHIRYQLQWDTKWDHQNFGPHKKSSFAFRANLYHLERHIGLWEVRITVKGLESGNTFDFVCLFTKVIPSSSAA